MNDAETGLPVSKRDNGNVLMGLSARLLIIEILIRGVLLWLLLAMRQLHALEVMPGNKLNPRSGSRRQIPYFYVNGFPGNLLTALITSVYLI